MRVLLVRHPEPDIAPGHCYGRLDVGLSAAGVADADRLRAFLRNTGMRRVYSSPARRCFALDPAAILDDRLQELDFGAWEGQSWHAIDRAALDAWATDPAGFAPPGGETGAALLTRVRAFVQDLLHRGEDAIVITHGGPLRLLPALLQRRTPDLLAPAPAFGAILDLQLDTAITVSTTASTTTAHPPNTSPVNPPI